MTSPIPPTANDEACLETRASDKLRGVENVSRLNLITAQVFATTRWTVVRACNHADDAKAQQAVAEICQAYWQPVYACIRHRGHSAHDAQDLTQEFFLRLLNGRYLRHLDQAKGRFRAYLCAALQNFLRDHWRRFWTLRRGRGATVVPLDAQEAENSYALVPATHLTPENLYERKWAQMVIGNVLVQLKLELLADRKEILFQHFDAILAGETGTFPYMEMAKTLGLNVNALHAVLFRWRRRFRTLMREEIARTVLSKAEIDDEMQHLLRVFTQAG